MTSLTAKIPMHERKKRNPTVQIERTRRHIIRQLWARGEIEEAGAKAQEWGIDIEDCKLPADSAVPAELTTPPDESLQEIMRPKDPAPVLPTSPDVPPPAISERWPEMTDLVVQGQPINTRMVSVKLPDGRRAILWKRGGNFTQWAKVRGRLCDQVGPEAYYEPVVS